MRYNWKSEPPTIAGYYQALPKDRDSWLDGTPEIVYVIFDGHWHVLRPGCYKHYKFTDFIGWGEQMFVPPHNEDD